MTEFLGIPIGPNLPTGILCAHLLIAGFFLFLGVNRLVTGGELLGVALNTLTAVLVVALGVAVSRIA